MLYKFPTSKGFTLVELLLVISIVGFLSTLIIVSISDTRTKAFDTRRISDINDLQKALALYNNDAVSYPAGTNLILGSVNAGCLSANGFTAFCPVGPRVYMGSVPANPGPGGSPYIYNQTQGGQSYTLTFELETTISNITVGSHTLTPSGIQ